MEQVRNEQTIYSAAVYCRLSKDDEQAGMAYHDTLNTANRMNNQGPIRGRFETTEKGRFRQSAGRKATAKSVFKINFWK